jgi:hypothetical protein
MDRWKQRAKYYEEVAEATDDETARRALRNAAGDIRIAIPARQRIADRAKARVAELVEYRQYLWDVLRGISDESRVLRGISDESRALRQGGPDESDFLELHDALDRCVDIAATVLQCDEAG